MGYWRMVALSLSLAVLTVGQAYGQIDSGVEIVLPKKGTSLRLGDTLTMRWILHGSDTPNLVTLLLSTTSGLNWSAPLSGLPVCKTNPAAYTDSTGTLKWVIADTILMDDNTYQSPVSDSCQIMVDAPYDLGYPTAVSGYFAIARSSGIRNALRPADGKNSLAVLGGDVKSGPDGIDAKLFTLSGRSLPLQREEFGRCWYFQPGQASGMTILRLGNQQETLLSRQR
jgi:hypothetical protein